MSANGMDNAAAAKLRHVIGRVERIDEQIAGLNEDKSEVYQEAKSFGLDVKAVKALVAKRRKVSKDPAAFTELEAVVELYEAALGSRPSRMQVRARAENVAPRQEEIDTETGEVLGDAPPAEAPMTAEKAAAHLARLTGATEVLVNGRSAYPTPRRIEPRTPEPAE